MKKLVVGILAHVDAGKTTSIESMLYLSGKIRKMGRVDHQDAFLDFDAEERNHGITIYSKEANFRWKDTDIYVIDTPGHVDFSSEMERCLKVLDLAIILVNGQNGVQSHTETIWKCLEHYHVPTVVFVNKMDISYLEKEELMKDIRLKCSENCIDLTDPEYMDKLAMVNEEILEEYLGSGEISAGSLRKAVRNRECFPCLFGSALKVTGMEDLLNLMADYGEERDESGEFGARVYKISQDDQGNRLTHVRITSGVLKSKQKISEEEKVDQIRVYNGKEFNMVNEAGNGTICVLKGLEKIEAGMGLGIETGSEKPLLSAYMSYELLLPHGANVLALAETCRQLAEEDPALEMVVDPESGHITLQMMGEMQKEILEKKILERSGIAVGFGTGRIIYRETIAAPVIGAGHFEPLRHYAEVQVRISPLSRGSGIVIANDCPSDTLSVIWQRSIISCLKEKHHRGVLTGSELTDVKITLLAGKGHLKHTEGGDFRQASSRAVRHGLMKAESIVLEPYYDFVLTVPGDSLSRALFELETRQCEVQVEDGNNGMMVITGKGPVRLLVNYQSEVITYTRGQGKFSCSSAGYFPVKEQEALVEEIGYDPDRDLRNPTGSVFCAHGAGFFVPWNEVEDHLELVTEVKSASTVQHKRYVVGEEEMKTILERTSGNNRNPEKNVKPKKKKMMPEETKHVHVDPPLPVCMVIDGYNMIYGWDSLKYIASEDIGTAREKLIDMLFNYQGYVKHKMIVVFDGYKAKGNYGSETNRGNMSIVYTRTNETADQYIERICAQMKKNYRLMVASSDGLIQNSVFSHGASRMSARELENQIKTTIQIYNN